jgi:hypothetical protein
MKSVRLSCVAMCTVLLLQSSCALVLLPALPKQTVSSSSAGQTRWASSKISSSCRSSVTMKALEANGVLPDQPAPVVRRMFGGLSASAFQHPFDSDATSTLRRLPGLEAIVRSFIPVIEVSFSACVRACCNCHNMMLHTAVLLCIKERLQPTLRRAKSSLCVYQAYSVCPCCAFHRIRSIWTTSATLYLWDLIRCRASTASCRRYVLRF